jgi:hypothetical protein
METPAHGLVVTVVNGRELPLSYAEYWTDHQGFVVRSTEFDCVAEGNDLDEALGRFGQAVYDYADDLQARMDSGAATATERETLQRLSDRLSRIYLAKRRVSSRRSRIFRRHRGDRSERRDWRPVVHA